MSLGIVEIPILILISLILFAIPAAGLVLLILIYQKVNQIERLLDRQRDRA